MRKAALSLSKRFLISCWAGKKLSRCCHSILFLLNSFGFPDANLQGNADNFYMRTYTSF